MESSRIGWRGASGAGALLVLALAAAVAGAAPDGERAEPVPPLPAAEAFNLDFEEGADARGRPVGWDGGGRGYELAEDLTVAHGGLASGRIHALESELTDGEFAPLVQWLSAEPWRGKRARLSGWLRTRDVASGWAGLWMRIDSSEAPGLAFDNMPTRGPRGTTEWARYEVVLDVAEEASELYFGVVLAGNGTVWADDLALEEVTDSVATTAPEPLGG